ncbi:MAG: hypothetical protein Q4A06_10245 [Cardiobacteriaceae bacterium]|nr:hypothetical protein [Cardiobacteriaceae bacterium]
MLRRTVLLLSLSLLAACGFHLKGTGRHALHVEGGVRLVAVDVPEEAVQAVKEAFAHQNLTLDSKTARYVIRLRDFENSRFESAIGGEHGQSRAINLRKGFVASIEEGDKVLASQPLASETSINYHSEQYLGNLADDERAQQALNRDNADKLLRFFQATVAQP